MFQDHTPHLFGQVGDGQQVIHQPELLIWDNGLS